MAIFNFMFHLTNFWISSNCYVLYECITYYMYLLLKNCIVGYARERIFVYLLVYIVFKWCYIFLLYIRPFIIVLVCYNTISDESQKSPIHRKKNFKIILFMFVCFYALKETVFIFSTCKSGYTKPKLLLEWPHIFIIRTISSNFFEVPVYLYSCY